MRCCHFEVYISSYCVFIVTARVSSKDDVTDEEDLADTSLVLVEDQKSVILHLLSKLKLGMDLTQVVLPTFILEKRSLLEMFADCMGHPQLFVWSVSFFFLQRSLFVVCSIYKTFGEINSSSPPPPTSPPPSSFFFSYSSSPFSSSYFSSSLLLFLLLLLLIPLLLLLLLLLPHVNNPKEINMLDNSFVDIKLIGC
jgi:hypothetical protein